MALSPETREDGNGEFENKFRVIPLRCLDEWRQKIAATGNYLFEGELHTTTDKLRVYLCNKFVGPNVWLGEVGSEADMLALHATHPRGCERLDQCYRTDTGTRWTCIEGHGETIDQWIAETVAAPSPVTGHWEPMTNGDPADPQLMFDAGGDVVMGWVEE